MANLSIGRVLSFSTISISLYVVISIGVVIRLGQSQPLNAAITPTEPVSLPLAIPEPTPLTPKQQTFSDTIGIRFDF